MGAHAMKVQATLPWARSEKHKQWTCTRHSVAWHGMVYGAVFGVWCMVCGVMGVGCGAQGAHDVYGAWCVWYGAWCVQCVLCTGCGV